MPQWQVRDVMTTEVITARDDASFAEIAAMFAGRRISAVPIVDRLDVVVGVVSWTDLRDKIDRWAPPLLRRPGRTAAELMTAPPLTIGPEASLPAAARVMYRGNVGRLLVVDGCGRARGIVARSDLLKVHARPDAAIRDEVMFRVLRWTLIEPGTVQATVDDGVVTLTGRTGGRATAVIAARLTEAVAGVTRVIDELVFDIDDAPAADDRLPGHSAYAQKATRSAALQWSGSPRARHGVPTPPPRPKRKQRGTIVDLLDPTSDVRVRLSDTGGDVDGVNGDIVDEWCQAIVPAGDPPANW
jgi:CBS domain-containing protein